MKNVILMRGKDLWETVTYLHRVLHQSVWYKRKTYHLVHAFHTQTLRNTRIRRWDLDEALARATAKIHRVDEQYRHVPKEVLLFVPK